MRELKKKLEMLEEAVRLLSAATATASRLSLILLDNLAEIVMYEKVRRVLAQDKYYSRIIKPTYPPQRRERLLRDFKEKVNLLVYDIRCISEDDGKVLKGGHILRNEAYHTGLVHEAIREVAPAYCEVVCRLLPSAWPGVLVLTPGGGCSEFLSQYGTDAPTLDAEALGSICRRILGPNAVPAGELSRALSRSLLGRIQDLAHGLESLRDTETPPPIDRGCSQAPAIPSVVLQEPFLRGHRRWLSPVRSRLARRMADVCTPDYA